MLQKIVNERINGQRNDDYFASYIDNSKRAHSLINGAVITDMAATARTKHTLGTNLSINRYDHRVHSLGTCTRQRFIDWS